MRILVCVKQVPEAGEVLFHQGNYTLQREKVQMIPNPADTSCFEIALRIQEKYGAQVSLLSMGPDRARGMLQNLAAVGGDDFYLVSDPAFAGADTYATATVISRAVSCLGGFDLILCGDKSTDGETGQVGPELAALLGYDFKGSREDLTTEDEDVVSAIGNGGKDFPLPLVAALRRSCVLRCPSLSGLRRSSRVNIQVLNAEMLGGRIESLTKVIGMKKKEIRRRKVILCQNEKELLERLQADVILTQMSGTGLKPSAKSVSSDGVLSLPASLSSDNKELDTEKGAASTAPVPQVSGRKKKWMLIKPPGTQAEAFEELRRMAEQRSGGEILEVVCDGNMVTTKANVVEAGEMTHVKSVVTARIKSGDVTLTGSVLTEMIRQEAPSIILFAADAEGKQIASWIAGKLGIGLTAELTDFKMDEEGRLHQFRSGYGASLQAEIINCNGSITMATVKVKQERASLIIAGGMGAGKKGFALLQELAELTGGVLGATRAAVDAGLAPFSSQIGQSGIRVRPRLYMAFGISGAVQHLAGMKESDRIVAVNTDRKAAVFDYADYGICGDAAETAAKLIRRIRAMRQAEQPDLTMR